MYVSKVERQIRAGARRVGGGCYLPRTADRRELACGGREWQRFDRAHFGSADLGGGPIAVLLMVNERRGRRDWRSYIES